MYFMEKKRVKVKVWKEGKTVLVRSDEFHINTRGKNFDDALKNFEEAYFLAIEQGKEGRQRTLQNAMLVIEYPLKSKKLEQTPYLAELKSQRKIEEQAFLEKAGGDEAKAFSLWLKEVEKTAAKHGAPKWLENARRAL